jgi:CHAT domain-containing protein
MKGFVGNIFLAPNAVYPNGIVDANEIVEKKLTNKLIVLSSCKSSLGSLRSSGMLGLSMSFLLSGSKNVISSLWSVNDKTTFFLMKEFYNSLLETDNYSKSLKEAILLTKKAYPNYLDWAGFYLYI